MSMREYGGIGIPEQAFLKAAEAMQFDHARIHRGVSDDIEIYKCLLDAAFSSLWPGSEPMPVRDFKVSVG